MTENSREPGASPGRLWKVGWPVGLVLLAIALSSLTTVDKMAEAEYEKVFQRAFITFALARTLNGVISAVQGTELAVQPAGVGVTLTPGEILDPVNDLVERFSWVMLGATLSLGVQQVLLDMGQWWGLRLVVALLGLAWLWVRLKPPPSLAGSPDRGRWLLKVFLVMVFLRFAVPFSLIVNEGIYDLFLESKYQQSTEVIETAGAELEAAQAEQPIDPETDAGEEGFLDALEKAWTDTRESMDIGRKVELIREKAADLVEHLVQLCVVFILQTGVLPIAFLWCLLQFMKQLFRYSGR